ncbi:MAG: restriction endonuclease subunit S [Spirochaetia bacterium]|nr:restriction endonuclease subunit S [Spirochaetia bacterium]
MMEIQNATLASLSVDGRGSYGIGASAVERSEDLYTYLRITDIRDDGTLNMVDLKSVDDEKASQYLLKPNDIVFARTGASTGRNYFYDGTDGEFVYAGFLIKFSIDPNKVNPKYVKYYCMSDAYKGWIHSFNTGSTRGNINAQTLGGMPVPIPPRPQQDGIVDILSSLDEKIRKNTEINENLLQQAQVIYCDMFITNASPSWQLGHLADLITVRYGKDHKKLADGAYPVYGSGGIMRYVERPLYDKESVLIPRKGTLNNVMYVNEPFWSVDTMFFTEMKVPNIAKFVFHFVKSKDLASLNAGSAVPSMTTDILNAMELYIPDADTFTKFEGIVAPMYQTIQQNTQESSKLSELRDLLLPRLMSGKLDVHDIDI